VKVESDIKFVGKEMVKILEEVFEKFSKNKKV